MEYPVRNLANYLPHIIGLLMLSGLRANPLHSEVKAVTHRIIECSMNEQAPCSPIPTSFRPSTWGGEICVGGNSQAASIARCDWLKVRLRFTFYCLWTGATPQPKYLSVAPSIACRKAISKKVFFLKPMAKLSSVFVEAIPLSVLVLHQVLFVTSVISCQLPGNFNQGGGGVVVVVVSE